MSLSKCENFCWAVQRLSEALEEYAAHPGSTVMCDGIIHRFKFSFELGWKSLKEYMENQGSNASELSFPKQVLKAAYAVHLIDDGQIWLDMLAARNITSHIYDDAQASQGLVSIRDRFITHLSNLAERYMGSACNAEPDSSST